MSGGDECISVGSQPADWTRLKLVGHVIVM